MTLWPRLKSVTFLVGPGNIDCCLQLSALDALEEVVDFVAIVPSIVILICKALHGDMLFHVVSG